MISQMAGWQIWKPNGSKARGVKNLKRETLKTKTVFMIMILNPNRIQKCKTLFTKSTVLFDNFFLSLAQSFFAHFSESLTRVISVQLLPPSFSD